MWEIWQKLNEDISYNLETCALVLLWGASESGFEKVNLYNYYVEHLREILKEYNGAYEYADKNSGLYNIIEKYNKQARGE